MGLDGVELVMQFEETFGIQITDEEAANCSAPRMVIEVVMSKLKAADEHICRSQRAFYLIRKVLVRAFGVERKLISPDTHFRDFIPQTREKEAWEQIQLTLEPRDWPGLARPPWLSAVLRAIGLVVFGATVAGMIRCGMIQWRGSIGAKDWIQFVFVSTFGAGVLTLLYGVIAALLTRPYCVFIPADIRSIRDVIPYAMTSNHMPAWTREDVAMVVKRIVMDQLGLDESSYTEDSRFVEDFNMD
jgi:acyl carrier protein